MDKAHAKHVVMPRIMRFLPQMAQSADPSILWVCDDLYIFFFVLITFIIIPVQ